MPTGRTGFARGATYHGPVLVVRSASLARADQPVIAPWESLPVACLIPPAEDGTTDFVGIDAIFEYTNGDGSLCRTNCGQAAAATFLTHHGRLPAEVARAHRI